MASLIKPDHFSVERWAKAKMDVDLGNGIVKRDFFVFTGIAHFDKPTGQLTGTGSQNSNSQLVYVEYEVTDMIVGPHWNHLDQVCPMVVAAGHDQHKPDTAEALGYEIMDFISIKLVADRIELHFKLKVRGGWSGEVPALAYHVTAIGELSKNPGNEGAFFKAFP